MSAILNGLAARVEGSGVWLDSAARILGAAGASVSRDREAPTARLSLGEPPVELGFAAAPDSDSDWAESGAMALTGHADGPPLAVSAPVASSMRGAAAVLALLTHVGGREVRVDGPALLGERAAAAGLQRRGREAPGGHCRLVEAADGWLALSLPREEDRALVPALLERAVPTRRAEVWSAVEGAARHQRTDDLVSRARMLGFCAAPLQDPEAAASDSQARARGQAPVVTPWLVDGRTPGPATEMLRRGAKPRLPRPMGRPLVIDCSALWAGPLCSHLLGLAGARIVKVEDPARPDGARQGPPDFYDLMHGGHESVAVDLSTSLGRSRLTALFEQADVVIEGSRPRAFEHLGVDRALLRAGRPELVWLSVTGYGATGPGRNWPALGDDAAVAAGLAAMTDEGPVLVGDAIADPLTGIHAAIAVVACLLGRRGAHIDISLREVVSWVVSARGRGADATPVAHEYLDGWALRTEGALTRVRGPRARPATRSAPSIGQHTSALLDRLHIR